MEDELLTTQELATRWKVNPRSIHNWRLDGTLSPCKGVPEIRFSLAYIRKLEGEQIERFSPLERKRLEREIEDLKLELEKKNQIEQQFRKMFGKVMQDVSLGINLIK